MREVGKSRHVRAPDGDDSGMAKVHAAVCRRHGGLIVRGRTQGAWRGCAQVWRARVSAYEELAKVFRTLPSADDPEYRKWIGSLKKMVVDANAAAQDAGLAALIVFLQNADIGGQYGHRVTSGARHGVPLLTEPPARAHAPGPPNGARLRSRASVVPGLIDKGLSAARANTKAKAVEALLYYFEFDSQDAVVVRAPFPPPP